MIKSKLILVLLLSAFTGMLSAQKLVSKNGHIWFFSHTPMEDIEAHNHQVASILDPATGELVCNVLIKSFEFKKALMQEHFNENYMESGKFPKASFKGKIVNLSSIDFKKDGTYPAEVSGDITIHGVTKQVSAKGNLTVKGSAVTANSKFSINPRDFDIKIPAVVENKIAKDLEVTVDITYNPY